MRVRHEAAHAGVDEGVVPWVLVGVGEGGFAYPWPIWLVVPGTLLLGATFATQAVRHGRTESPKQLPPSDA